MNSPTHTPAEAKELKLIVEKLDRIANVLRSITPRYYKHKNAVINLENVNYITTYFHSEKKQYVVEVVFDKGNSLYLYSGDNNVEAEDLISRIMG